MKIISLIGVLLLILTAGISYGATLEYACNSITQCPQLTINNTVTRNILSIPINETGKYLITYSIAADGDDAPFNIYVSGDSLYGSLGDSWSYFNAKPKINTFTRSFFYDLELGDTLTLRASSPSSMITNIYPYFSSLTAIKVN